MPISSNKYQSKKLKKSVDLILEKSKTKSFPHVTSFERRNKFEVKNSF